MCRAITAVKRRPLLLAAIIAAGAAFHVAAEAWWKGLLILAGAVLLDVGIDLTVEAAEDPD